MKKALIITAYVLVFWIALPGCLIFFSLFFDNRLDLSLGPSILRTAMGFAITAISALLLFLSIFHLKKYGGGLPVSAMPPKKLARRGIYSIWRHPVYLFFTTLFLGIALIMKSGGMLCIVLPLFAAAETAYALLEERALIQRYGTEYMYYKKTAAFFLPRLSAILKIPARLLFKLVFSYSVTGEANIPDTVPFFIVAAHRNYLDPFFIANIIGWPVHYVATYEVFRKLLTRLIFQKFMCIPKKRYLNDISAIRKIKTLLDCKAVIGIFPEGRRSWTGTVGRLKPEALKLFRKYHNIPILPVKLEGNYHSWPRWAKNLRRAKLSIVIQKPMLVARDNTLEEIEKRIRKEIEPLDISAHCKSKNRAGNIALVIYRCPVCRTFNPVKIAGKAEFECAKCLTRFSILKDYMIEYNEGGSTKRESIDTLYNRIRIQDSDIQISDDVPLKHRGIAGCNNAAFFEERGNRIVKLFSGTLLLTNKNLLMECGKHKLAVDLESVLSVTIESNYKLQVFESGKNKLYQIVFECESALKWQDYLLKVIENEFGFLPNDR